MPDSQWIELEPEQLNQHQPQQEEGGVEVVVGLSPFDVPDAVRGYKDDSLNRFVIELRYLGEEERQIPQKLDDHISLQIGENSKRLYEIHLDLNILNAESVSFSIVDKAIERFANQKENPRKKAIYRMAGAILKQKGKEVMLAK